MAKVVGQYTDIKMSRQKPAQQTDAARALRLLIEAYGHEPDLIPVAELEKMADRLSIMAGKDPPWGWRYLRNILNQKIDASPRLLSAIYALGAAYDGLPPIVAAARRMNLLVTGNVTPGAVVLADSRKCANPACPVEFVPRSTGQRYCCPDCRARMNELRRQERRNRGGTDAPNRQGD